MDIIIIVLNLSLWHEASIHSFFVVSTKWIRRTPRGPVGWVVVIPGKPLSSDVIGLALGDAACTGYGPRPFHILYTSSFQPNSQLSHRIQLNYKYNESLSQNHQSISSWVIVKGAKLRTFDLVPLTMMSTLHNAAVPRNMERAACLMATSSQKWYLQFNPSPLIHVR